MTNRTLVAGLSVAEELFNFIETQVLPGLRVTPDHFWTGLSEITHELGPKNRTLLAEREVMQAKIDQWHIAVSYTHLRAHET